MQYFIKDINDQEHGPVDAETLEKWVEEDRITAETPVRSALMAKWKTAEQLPFLTERLAEQAERKEKAATVIQKSGSILKGAQGLVADKLRSHAVSRFEKKRPARYTKTRIRLMVGFFDLTVMLIILAIVYACGITYAYYFPAAQVDSTKTEIAQEDDMMIPIKKAEEERFLLLERSYQASLSSMNVSQLKDAKDDYEKVLAAERTRNREFRANMHENNLDAVYPPYTLADKNAGYQIRSIWIDMVNNEKYICLSGAAKDARWLNTKDLTKIITVCLAIWVVIGFSFNAFLLAYFAQTLGMWFWGVLITRRKNKEVYFFRAFIFTLLYPLCFIFSPLFVYIFRCGLHEILSGTRLVRVFSNPDA